MTEWPSPSPPGSSPPEPGPVTLTVVIPSAELQSLEQQAADDGITTTEAIQRSLAIGRIVWNASRSGGRAFVEDRHGEVREIEVPSHRPDASKWRKRMKM